MKVMRKHDGRTVLLFLVLPVLAAGPARCGPGETRPADADDGEPAADLMDWAQDPGTDELDAETLEIEADPLEEDAADMVEEEGLPPIRDDAAALWAWHEQAPFAIDGASLPAHFSAAGYTPPAGSEILVGRVIEGVEQPAYQLYDISGSSFSFDFWPASTIKLLAALGALDFMAGHGLTGDAVVTIHDDDGTTLTRSIRDIYSPAINVSSNTDYDRCVEIAGFDRLNETFLSPGRDLPTTVIQRRYGYHGSLRTSPPMDFVEGDLNVSVPERVGVGDFGCPVEGNCANLFEILNALRRVTLHDEIPAAERFELAPGDRDGLQLALLQADSYFEPAVEALFGAGALIYNKTGFVPDNDILDHGMVVDTATGERYLVAVSVPEATSSVSELSDLVEQALLFVLAADPDEHMPWQYDAGVSIRAQLDDGGLVDGRRRIHFTVDAPGADRIRLWTDTWHLGDAPGGPRFSFTYDYTGSGLRLLVIQAFSGTVQVGTRAMAVLIP